MKIERAKLKKSNSELPEACKPLRDSLAAAKDDHSMYEILKNITTWEYGKSELYHWVDVLDMFDDIMERCCQTVDGNKWMLACDEPENTELKQLMLQVMRFTSMLIEYSFQRHSYESMDHLITLMSSSDMDVVLEVLNVLYVFSKRSNFMGRLSAPKKHEIVIRLLYLAESWGGRENGFGLAECCQDLSVDSYPSSATTVHFEFYINRQSKTQPSNLCTIHLENVDRMSASPSEVMSKIMSDYEVPDNKQMLLFTHTRLAHSFSNFKQRTNCILARLQAISILVYSHAVDNEVAHQIIYTGFINELVNVLELASAQLIDMKAAVMRTLTAIIHLERNPKLEAIIDITGANTYHGFLPSLVRKCIQHMVEPAKTAQQSAASSSTAAGTTAAAVTVFPHSFSTALFSFLYHLASYESGGEALLSCGIMPSLLKLANWYSDEQEHITFVTRAVRIIDLMTNMDTQSFENHNGLKVFIDRLDHEVAICREEQPFIIRPKRLTSLASIDAIPMDVSDSLHSEADIAASTHEHSASHEASITDSQHAASASGGSEGADAQQQNDTDIVASNIEINSSEQSRRDNMELMDSQPSTSKEVIMPVLTPGLQCLPQRSALLKSILNFFKKVIPEPALSFADSIRHIMEGSMPKALQHIISNAEYYGASLFLLALDVVTVFVFQEPSLLSSLQDKGLTEIVLNSLLVKDVPTTREVLAALPNVFSALCLNQRGLDAFVEYKPFDKLFKVLLSPEYLPAMRKRKSSDAFGDTANNLGTAMDELMRHQPSLRIAAIKAIIGLLNEIIRLGTDTQYTCTSKNSDITGSSIGGSAADSGNLVSGVAQQNSDIDESEDDDEVTEGATEPTTTQGAAVPGTTATPPAVPTADADIATEQSKPVTAPKPVPLMDYIHNVMKFVDAIMGNSTADDHCMEFITQGGLEPLFTILRLPNLPVDFPTSQACQSVSSVCTILLKLCHEPKVISEGLKQLSEVLTGISKLYEPLPPPGGSVLLSELVSAVGETGTIPEAVSNPKATPLLHNLSAVQAFVKVFVHMCRFGQADLKQISLVQWGTERGLNTLSELGKLYYSLVWEGTVLLALCSDNDLLPSDSEFGRADLAKLLPKLSSASPKDMDTDSNSSVGVTAAMEGLSTADLAASGLSVPEDEVTSETAGAGGESSTSQAVTGKKAGPTPNTQMKQIRPLLNVSSRLGSTLAELFQNVLVKLCVGSVMLRQRRTHQPPPAPSVPSANARAMSKALCELSINGLNWKPLTDANVPKLHMYFLMSVVGFSMPMLFEENKLSYHLMLQEFSNLGGTEAFFSVFYDVVNRLPPSESFRGAPTTAPPSKLPDYLVEFLDTWLLLAEKMVHPKSILDSVYSLPAKGNTTDYKPFNPTLYLKTILKPVFNAVLRLWSHKALTNTKDADANLSAQLEQVAISMLTILCHIIQAEKVIKEREAKEAKTNKTTNTGASTSTSSQTAATATASTSGPRAGATAARGVSGPPGLAPLSDENVLLRDLMDMGFSRDRCVEALNFTSTVEAATEYLLTHMTTPTAASGSSQGQDGMELSEEDQIRAAIELSLTATAAEAAEQKKAESKPATPAEEIKPPIVYVREDDSLSSSDLDDLTDTLVSGCMNMLDSMPNTVFKICQLLVIVSNRNGNQWRENMFKQLFLEMTDVCTQLTEDALKKTWGSSKEQAVEYFTKSERNLKLASRMHLLTLLIQEVEIPCISVLQDNGFINSVLGLVSQCMPGFLLAGTAGTPQWLAPIMLIVDQCEKAGIASKRKAEAKTVLGVSTAWKWFDDRNGRWCAYNSTSNNTIDTAYKNGETSVRFTAGRRKYLVKFNAMIQLNEETGNRRPVMLTIPSKPDRDLRKMHNMEVDAEMSGLLPEQIQTLLRLCVDLISVPVECETLHAVLRLCLRCTRSHDMADLFVSCGGVDRLLKLSQASAFTGFTSLCTLIIRHILEDEQTLTITFSHVLKEVAAGIGSNLCGVSSTSMGSKEINYVMRQLGPAICRDPQLLKKVAQKQLRISLQNGKEPPWSTQHQVDLISCVEDKSLSLTQPPSETFRGILTSLLNILVDPYTKEPALDGSTDGKKTAEEGAADAVLSAAGSAAGSADLSATPNQLLQRLLTETSSTTVAATEKLKKAESELKEMTKENPIASADNLSRPLLSKSAVLRMLSEFVKSYPSCANIVVQHSYMAGQTDSVNETCTALSFIFDRLLPGNQEDGDKDCPALSRVLLASISSCNHSPEAQTSLVNELKTALQRTLSMPEVMTKYTHIQSLTALVSTLVEACPSTQNQLNKSPFPLKQISSNSMNSMVKLMVKRGLVSDIAKIPHSLDLSNPATVNTINALLKPLETLSRIVNQPQLGPAGVTGNRPALTRNEAQISSSNLPSQQNAIEGAAATENTTPNTADTTATTPASNGAAAATNGQQTNGTSGTAADPAAEDAAEDHHEAEFDQEDEDNDDMVAENDNNINYMRSFNQELNVLERETEALSRMLSRDLDRDRPVENGSNHSLPDDDDDDRDDDRDRQRLYNVHQQVNEVLEHALDEILSQGASEEDNDDDMGLGRPAAEATMSDSEVEEAEAIAQEEREDDEEADEPPPYHEDEEPDTSDEDDDDEDEVHDDDDDEGDNHNNGDNQDGGELGIDDDDAWSDDDDIGGGVGGGGGGGLLSNLLGLDDDDDLFSRLEAYDQMPFEGAGRPRILVAEPGAEGFRTLHVPLGHGAGQDPDSLMEEGGNTLPPAPNAVPVTHPLMNPSAASSEASRSHSRFMPGLARMRRNAGGAAASRAERLAGERMGHGLHMMSHAPQSNFLQRLFGAGMAANILQLTTRIGGTGAARLYISDDDPFRPSIRNDDEPYSDFLQDGMDLMKTGGGPGVLSSLPSTLYRWTEECRVLDGSSVHDVITAVKPEIIDKLQADKKEQIEATTKKEKEAKDKKSDDKKTTSGSTDIGSSAGSAPTESATAAGGSETERLENELRNLARNARTLADNVEDLQERLNLETLGNSNTELLNSMQALFGEEDNIAQDVARLYNRRRQEQRTLMSVPHPQPHTGTSDESAQPISTTANNTDIVSSLRAAISSAQRTLSTETTSSGSAGQPIPSTTANAPTTQATQPSDSSALTQTVSGNAIPVLAPSTREILLESLSYPLSVSLNSQPSGGEAVAAATQDTSETLTTAVQEQSNNQASLLESLTNQVTPACIEQEVDQDRACTPPNVFYDGDEPAPPPLAENRPDMPIPSTTLSTISDDNLLTARSGTEPPVELVSVAEAVTNSTAIDNSELSEDHPVVESVEADAVPTGTQGAAAADTGASQQTTTSAAAVVGDSVPGTSSGATEAPSNTSGLPAGLEGVDPSFLEALPESIRREVIAEQLRLARVQNHVRESTAAAAALTPPAASTTQAAASTSNTTTTATAGASQANSNVGDVSAEFLAALPPAIQEEVLAVQRAEQARQTAAAAGPDTAPDPGSFLNSLPPSLRQQVLADMDDSQISVLPADLMAEAQLLRGELEDRNRRLQDQLFTGGSTLGSILRQSGMSGWGGGGGGGVGRLSTSRFIRRGVGGSGFNGPWGSNSGSLRGVMKPVRRGRQLLDQEALTCLLVMLFLDEPRLNVSRLHRILKNLGYHSDTLLWIVRALISILMKTNESKDKASETSQASGKQISQSAWLSFGMDAALGCRANVFHVQHNTSSKRNAASSPGGGNVTIHPQAAQLVCQHVMDTLIYLSKAFTQQFLPNPAAGDVNPATKDKNKDQSVRSKSPKQATPTAAGTSAGPSFWDVLVRLDQMRLNKKGKGVQRMSTGVPSASPGAVGADDSLSDRCIEESPMGQLMTLLSSPVIRRSPALTDRLLKLLSNISTAITMDVGNKSSGSTSGRQHTFGGEYNPFSTRSANNAASSNASQSVTGKSIIKHDSILLPNQLKLAVEVLTSKSCSEEGLEDSTKLLLRLSNANNATKQNIVKLLLSGAQQIGHTVCEHIESLLKEAQEHNRQLSLTGAGLGEDSASDIQSLDPAAAAASDEPRPSTSSATSGARGLIANRYLPGSVVTVAPPKNKRTHDLQLPSMSLLTAKSSSQQFLLRLLKVVIQLSDKKSASRSSESADAGSSQALPAAPTPTRSIEESTAAANTAANTAAGTESAAAAESSAADTTLPDPGAAQPPTESTTEPAATSGEQKMEVDTQEAASSSISDAKQPLCERLDMDKLWQALGECLTELSRNSDQNAVLILQPAVEAFFLVHAGEREGSTARSRRDRHRREDQLSHLNLDEPPPSPASAADSLTSSKHEQDLSPETKKFLKFAETHRTVLNQILRQTQTPLSDGPFSVLVDHMKLLDFDVKNRYFKAELQKLDDGMRREDLAVHVRRDHVFEDSYRELFRRTPEEWKHRLYIVFEGEEGQDAGGLLREWYLIMSREIFNPNYALFMTTPQDRVTYTINQLSYYNNEHLSYFKFVGRIIAKAIYDNKLLECYFTRSFYKHITGQAVRYTDMEAEDYSFYQGLEFLLNNDVNDLGYDLTFSTEIQELGVTQTRELKPNGSNILVTEENKKEYVKLVCQLKMTGAIRKQLNAFLEGFYDVIPKYLISIFNEQELELLISGLPTVDVDDLKANSEYHKYNANSLQIIWFWRALRSFDQAERARFLQFVTGTSKVPLQGFAYLEGMNGTQKFQIHRDDRSTDRLPCAHTCFNQLDLPAYETYDKLKKMLLLVINECSEGFGLA